MELSNLLLKEVEKIVGKDKEINLSNGKVYYKWDSDKTTIMTLSHETLLAVINMYELIEYFDDEEERKLTND